MFSKKSLIILLVIVIVIVFGKGAYSIFIKTTSNESRNNILSKQSVQENIQFQQKFNPNQAEQDVFRCVSNDKYFVIEKVLTDRAGSDILVKYKSTNDQQYPCEYLVNDADFEIKSEWAEYIFALENDFLILDSGTSPPPRGLIIYDLTKRKEVFTDLYSHPIVISSNTVTYWSPTKIEPNEINCPKITEYKLAGLEALIEERVVLTLSTFNRTNLGEHRCSPTQ
jgi:hypothetical protein